VPHVEEGDFITPDNSQVTVSWSRHYYANSFFAFHGEQPVNPKAIPHFTTELKPDPPDKDIAGPLSNNTAFALLWPNGG